MVRIKIKGKRLFVLDTNVLMHDPTAIFKFQEHDVFIPMIVLEELDSAKKGLSEVARNARQTSRIFDEISEEATHEMIREGLAIPSAPSEHNGTKHGCLYFQADECDYVLPHSLPGAKPDNTILAVALALRDSQKECTVTLVSKDINLRLKANILGLHAEDYYNDRVLDDLAQLHTGYNEMPSDFWETHSKDLDSWQEEGHTFYRVNGPEVAAWFSNDFISVKGEEAFAATVRHVDGDQAVIELVNDHASERSSVWGINARNTEQNYALNLLLDPEIDFVTLQGSAGSGKTLLALAAGLVQTIEDNRYREIIMTRVTVPVGEDIGFLPGTEEEKMTPWMGALLDNLEVLHANDETSDWEKAATYDLLANRIKVRSLNFMRGRTFLNRFMIIDEAQNLTAKQMKTLITRSGPGTKLVCLGDLKQIDTPYLTEMSSGLTYAIDHFKTCEFAGHVTLRQGERSRLAAYAADNL